MERRYVQEIGELDRTPVRQSRFGIAQKMSRSPVYAPVQEQRPVLHGLGHVWSTAKRGIAKFPYETVGGEGGIHIAGLQS
ncbi:MAG TPA: hypothetical protein VMN56_03795, partial [Casimicrobiaceae bacterium]|nr:hypothetical protein [Casimicrobiaceae bacterium]